MEKFKLGKESAPTKFKNVKRGKYFSKGKIIVNLYFVECEIGGNIIIGYG